MVGLGGARRQQTEVVERRQPIDMRPAPPSHGGSIITLTAIAWIVLILGLAAVGAISPPSLVSLTDRPPLAVLATFTALALCSLAAANDQRSRAPSPLHHLPSLLAAVMLYLALDAQIIGFHEPRPPTLGVIALCVGTVLVAVVGRLILRASPS